jgi:signal transduction histidine kinase
MDAGPSRDEKTPPTGRPAIAGRRHPRTIRVKLIWLVLGCIVPAWIGVAVVIWSTYERERVLEGEATLETARALALAVDRDLASATTAAQVLAASPHIASLDLPALQFLMLSAAGALVLLGLVVWLAGHQSAQIIRTLQALVAPADALGRGEAPDVPALPIREVDEVGRSLNRAFAVMRVREDERDLARQGNRVAEVFARAKDELVGTVSHELRTPLTSIAGSLGLLAANAAGPLPDTAMRLIAIAHANSMRLVRLINDILDIESMASGRTVFEFARVDVRALVEQAIDANTGFAAGHNATLRLDAGVAAADVRADTGRLDQVLTNLISNAIKFSPPGGEVVVGIEARGGRCRVTVRDHGPGVPDHFRSRIFERFSQAEIADGRQKGGTGLGLSIVKQIVARLGGEAGFEDAAGGGTIFWVEVPFWEDPAAEARSPDEEPRMIPMAASA